MAPIADSLREAWRPVRAYEGFYEVSDLGQVRSLERVIVFEHPISGVLRQRLRGRLLLPSRCPRTGHLGVTLSREGSTKTFAVPRLVLDAFVGLCPDGYHAATQNDDPSDCRLSNLAWRPRSAIVLHAIGRGTRQVGDRHYKAKLTASDVLAIRAATGVSSRALAVCYGVSKSTITAIRRDDSWKSVSDPSPPTPPASPGPGA